MAKSLSKNLLASTAVFGVTLVVSTAAMAAEPHTTAKATQTLTAESLENSGATQLNQSTNVQVPNNTHRVENNRSYAEVMPVLPASAQAAETPGVVEPISQDDDKGSESNNTMSQVTSVSQLSDVQSTDWAFQALQSLVERYGCIVGYPDGTYRGNRALTRYEFAAGVSACLERVNELITSATTDPILFG